MAVAAFLVPMGLLSVLLLMAMASCSVVALPTHELHLAPAVNACGRRGACGAIYQRDSSSVILNDNADHAPTHHHQSHHKSNAPGFRFDMTRRSNKCAGLHQGSASRNERFACVLERDSRRQRQLAGKKATAEHLRTVNKNKERTPTTQAGEESSDWRFPESAGFGEFLVKIYLGTPPTQASVLIDSGSDLTWIQSHPCISCLPQEDPIFDPSKSSTYKELSCSTSLCQELVGGQCSSSNSCEYMYTYRDGSETVGNFSTESITVELISGESTAVDLFAFGASVYTAGPMANTEVEGVLGLGQGAVSFPKQLGSHFGNMFSYCLVDWVLNHTVTSSMYFGDVAVPAAEVMYTPILPNPVFASFYYIRVVGISVGGTVMSIDQSVFEIDSSGSGGTILDTGTTITYFHQAAYDEIAAAYKSQVTYPISATEVVGLDLCFNTAGVETPTFPLMEIHLDGAHLSLPKSNTFISFEGDITCLAVMPAYYEISIIGNTLQQNFDVVYDLENNSIGFTPADCASI